MSYVARREKTGGVSEREGLALDNITMVKVLKVFHGDELVDTIESPNPDAFAAVYNGELRLPRHFTLEAVRFCIEMLKFNMDAVPAVVVNPSDDLGAAIQYMGGPQLAIYRPKVDDYENKMWEQICRKGPFADVLEGAGDHRGPLWHLLEDVRPGPELRKALSDPVNIVDPHEGGYVPNLGDPEKRKDWACLREGVGVSQSVLPKNVVIPALEKHAKKTPYLQAVLAAMKARPGKFWIAGGFVVQLLLRGSFKGYKGDIDVFCSPTCTVEDVKNLIDAIHRSFGEQPHQIHDYRGTTYTFVTNPATYGEEKPIQVIANVPEGVAGLLNHFDIAACRAAFDGTNFHVHRSFLAAISAGFMLADATMMRTKRYFVRLMKWAVRLGLAVYDPLIPKCLLGCAAPRRHRTYSSSLWVSHTGVSRFLRLSGKYALDESFKDLLSSELVPPHYSKQNRCGREAPCCFTSVFTSPSEIHWPVALPKKIPMVSNARDSGWYFPVNVTTGRIDLPSASPPNMDRTFYSREELRRLTVRPMHWAWLWGDGDDGVFSYGPPAIDYPEDFTPFRRARYEYDYLDRELDRQMREILEKMALS